MVAFWGVNLFRPFFDIKCKLCCLQMGTSAFYPKLQRSYIYFFTSCLPRRQNVEEETFQCQLFNFGDQQHVGEGPLCCGLFCLTAVRWHLDSGSMDGAAAKKTAFLPQYFPENLRCALHKNRSREVLQENPVIQRFQLQPIFSLNFIKKLLRFNRHTIQFTHLKCRIQWILVQTQNCATFRMFSSLQEETQLLATANLLFLSGHFMYMQ